MAGGHRLMANNRVDWQRQAETFEERQGREVLARFGLAAFYGQCVERQLGIMLASMYNDQIFCLEPGNRDSAFDEQFAKTLGRMAKDLDERVQLPSAFEGRLRHAVRQRNWLAHSYFWDRAFESGDSESCEEMIFELNELADFFRELDVELTQVHQVWLDSVGISREAIRQELHKVRSEKR